MKMKTGERWHCTNPACHCEVLVQSGACVDGANPACSCGSLMKKAYKPPVFRYLDFLNLDEPQFAPKDGHEE